MTPAPGRSAAFFDLDKTVIARSSTLAFSRPFYAGGLIRRRAMLRSAYAHFFYQVNGADHDQMERMRRYLSALCAGWEVQQVQAIVAEALDDRIGPLVYDEATALIAEHRAAGRDVVIVSASGAEVVSPIGEMLGADHVVATRMQVAGGRYTGEVEFYAYGEAKADAVRQLAADRGYDLTSSFAYSDSATDLPMLAAVGQAVAVNPDKALRREALDRGWPVLDFTHPVRLRSRLQHRASSGAAAARAGARAAAAGLPRPRRIAATVPAAATPAAPAAPAHAAHPLDEPARPEGGDPTGGPPRHARAVADAGRHADPAVPTVAVALGAGAATVGLVLLARRRLTASPG